MSKNKKNKKKTSNPDTVGNSYKIAKSKSIEATLLVNTNNPDMYVLCTLYPASFEYSERVSIYNQQDKAISMSMQHLTYLVDQCVELADSEHTLSNAFVDDITGWNNTVFTPFLLSCIENNTPFQFQYLTSIIKMIVGDGTVDIKNGNCEVAANSVDKAAVLIGYEGSIGRYMSCEVVKGWTGTFLKMKLSSYLWYRSGVRACHDSVTIRAWSGTRTLSSLGISFGEDQIDVDTASAQGKKVVAISQDPYYGELINDWMEVKSWYGWNRASAKGRVMVDQAGMIQTDPNSLYNVTDSVDLVGSENDDDQKVSLKEWTDVDYAMVRPYLYGFSFAAKQWGRFYVDHVEEISFREDAFDKLVMDKEDKSLILSLVRNVDSNSRADFVDGKGGGCVFLFHGKPGLGKTLTAETVAEEVRRPLYSVSVGELGTNVEALEEKLNTVLQLGARWNAVLLLDEADIFLEERSQGDVVRNAMVGTFLRLLEYYNGILVLTSNRVECIDQAFYSRISLAKHYKEHDQATRKQIVTNLLSVYNVKLPTKDVVSLSKMKVNGRQLKNSIRLATFLANEEKRSVTVSDINSILTRVTEFTVDVRKG